MSLETRASFAISPSTSGSTRTAIDMLRSSPGASAPKLHVVGRNGSPGSPALQDAPLPETLSIATPAGRTSSTTTFSAVEGPVFIRSSV